MLSVETLKAVTILLLIFWPSAEVGGALAVKTIATLTGGADCAGGEGGGGGGDGGGFDGAFAREVARAAMLAQKVGLAAGALQPATEGSHTLLYGAQFPAKPRYSAGRLFVYLQEQK